MLKLKILTIFMICIFVTGCSTTYYTRLPEKDILPEASRVIRLSELKEFYDYKSNQKKIEICLIKEYPDFKIYQIKFPFALKKLFPEKDLVEFEYYLPKGEGKFPAVVVLPHLAGKAGLETFFAKGLVRKNFAVLAIEEPYFSRDHREGKWWMHQLQNPEDLEKIKRLFRELVVDTRRGIDFLESQPEIDRKNIGLLGLSLGGCLAVVVMGVDQRIKVAAFLLAGGDLVALVKQSQYAKILRKHMEKGNISFKAMGENWRQIEPLTIAPFLNDREILMINATFDHIMPCRCTKKLWQALGKPRIIWIPSGHYGAAIFINYARVEVMRFFVRYLCH